MKCLGIDCISGAALEISGSAILSSVEPLIQAPNGLEHVSPGFIDIQVNGFAGVDYNSANTPHDEIARSIRAQYACGVTRFFPTVITGGPDQMSGALRNLADAKESLAEGVAMEAFHVEGPHISPDDGPRGAHPRQWVRRPDIEEFHRWQDAARGNIRLVTLAPEWPEATSYIEEVVRQGVVIAIGHTNATGAQIRDAVNAGATLSTHLGNGAHQMLLRHPNYIWEQLADDRLAADFIVDGIHLPESYLRVALRAKGIERSILVTDAATPAGQDHRQLAGRGRAGGQLCQCLGCGRAGQVLHRYLVEQLESEGAGRCFVPGLHAGVAERHARHTETRTRLLVAGQQAVRVGDQHPPAGRAETGLHLTHGRA